MNAIAILGNTEESKARRVLPQRHESRGCRCQSAAELQRFRAAARAAANKDKRVNIRLSSADLLDIQVNALAEGMPYQTLIASVLHKCVSGKLSEQEPAAAIDSRRRHVRRADRKSVV